MRDKAWCVRPVSLQRECVLRGQNSKFLLRANTEQDFQNLANIPFSLFVLIIIISFEVLQQQTFVKPLKSIALAGGGENYD